MCILSVADGKGVCQKDAQHCAHDDTESLMLELTPLGVCGVVSCRKREVLFISKAGVIKLCFV